MFKFTKIVLFIMSHLLSVPCPVSAAAIEHRDSIVQYWCPLLVIALIFFFILLWNRLLHRQVAERTVQLQQHKQELEMKVAERTAELLQSQGHSQAILNAMSKSGEGLLIIDSDYRIREMNSVMIDWFGDQTGKNCHRSLGGLEQPCPCCQLERVIQQGETVNYQPTAPDGRVLEIVATPINNSDGSTSKMEMIRDISARIKDQQDLEDSRLQLKLAMEAANLGSWDWRPQSDELFTNDIFLTMFGYAPDAFPETTERWAALVHPDDMESIMRVVQPLLDGDDTPYNIEYRMRNADGQWCWVLDVGQVVERDAERKAVRFIGVHIDITEYKQVAGKQIEKIEDYGLRGAKILLVEDNELNQELANVLLDREGMFVTSVWNGQEALEILHTERFDGILMDLQMPVMDGYEATREIRKLPQYKTLPIIAITANVMTEDREKAMAAGMNDYMGKPFKKLEMFRTMARWITPSEPCLGENVQVVDEKEQKPETEKQEKILVGIDMQEGLEICLDDPKLYQKILGMFCQYYRNFEQDFLKAQQGDEPQTAIRLAHTLKGAACEIGATDIPQLAQSLETLCHEGGSRQEISIALQELIKELNPLIVSVDRFLAEVTKKSF